RERITLRRRAYVRNRQRFRKIRIRGADAQTERSRRDSEGRLQGGVHVEQARSRLLYARGDRRGGVDQQGAILRRRQSGPRAFEQRRRSRYQRGREAGT